MVENVLFGLSFFVLKMCYADSHILVQEDTNKIWTVFGDSSNIKHSKVQCINLLNKNDIKQAVIKLESNYDWTFHISSGSLNCSLFRLLFFQTELYSA